MPSVLVPGDNGINVIVNYDQPAYAALAQQFVGPTSLVYDTFSGPVGATYTIYDGIDVETYAVGATTNGGIGGVLYLISDSYFFNQHILSGYGTNLVLYVQEGAGTVVGGGADTVVIAAGNPQDGTGDWNITESGSSQIFLTDSTGNDTVTIDGSSTVVGGNGNLLVYGSNGYTSERTGQFVPGASAIFAPNDGRTLTFVGGAGSDTVVANAAGGQIVAYGGTGPGATTYWLGAAQATLINADGNMVVHSGSAADPALRYFGGAGSEDTIPAGERSTFTGTMVFSGASNGNVFVTNDGNQFIDAFGATGNGNQFYAGTGTDYLIGGAGNDYLFGGSGISTLTGGGGDNVFAFGIAQGGDVTVSDFGAGDAVELLNGVTITGQDTTSDPGSLLVTLSDSTTVTFTGLTSDLSSGQVFHF
jgi:Ca2+-binding RTX toxin-like protein